MTPEDASAYGRDLLVDLLRLRLETCIDDRPRRDGVAVVPDRRGTETPVGALPPTDPAALIAAARGRIPTGPRPELVATEVSARLDQAEELLRRLDPYAFGPRLHRDTTDEPPPLDQRGARQLARFWELGARPVVCRTLVTMEGDAATQFPAGDGHYPAGITRDAVVRAHATISLAMLALWPVLMSLVGVVAVALLPESPRAAWRRLREGGPPGPVGSTRLRPFRVTETVRNSRRFLAWGRVVFETPAGGPPVLIRSMVHPSGDVETTILGGATDHHIDVHAALVAQWIGRLAASLRRLSTLLRSVPAGLFLLVTGSASAAVRDVAVSLAAALLGAVLGWAAKAALRAWLRRRVLALIPVRAEPIEHPGR